MVREIYIVKLMALPSPESHGLGQILKKEKKAKFKNLLLYSHRIKLVAWL